MVWNEENFKGAVTAIDRECGRNGYFKDHPGIRFWWVSGSSWPIVAENNQNELII
jgi:hypothetical protein